MIAGSAMSRRLALVVFAAGCTVALPACSPYRFETSTEQAPGSIIDMPHSRRGNPPFYEVFGERYYVLESSAGYRERGVASWYGRDFHGQPTSGGESYDMYALTAAHKSLPIPTWVEVTNLSNGKRVMVKVNDRGPFVDNRIIDLSYRAADDIGMLEAGTAQVEVRALGASAVGSTARPTERIALSEEPERSRGFSIISEAVADTPQPGDQSFKQLYVQVGAFAEQDNATGLTETLKDKGFGNSFVIPATEGGPILYRVRIGPLNNAAQFDLVNDGLRSLGMYGSRLVVEP